ncbi:hypothetical protein ACJ72_06541 [Emergomyces africanus]|uniref:Ysc84 actin-binding domain-containing protein n=1 Tax=Emergomyces africanus TaxID=1955775 RepID=A0A1B7NQP1_9EURO|nr:hypothetical protein ACJ72_06541 [Emergomyces africanus]
MSHPKWEKTKVYSKRGFDKVWNTVDKLGPPVNRLSNKLGAEAFWPTTLDKESEKAARILRSFCKDGFYTQTEKANEEANDANSRPNSKDGADTDGDKKKEVIDKPRGEQRVVKKIPSVVIKEAKGLAIFTTMRAGLWFSGAGGSGILVARAKETGEWSPPSGIMLHTAGLGFLAGVDIYDCVAVINTYQALEAFKMVRCTLGGEVSAVAGPFGVGGVMDSEVHKRRAPVWTYLKSRGLYAGVQVDGTIIIERSDENERFYGERIPVADILAGKAKHPPASIGVLMQTIKAAQGDTDVDENMLPPPGETPGDADVETDTFGVPPLDDPDPFGVKALEKEGVIMREAGTKRPVTVDMFEFRPSSTSPLYNRLSTLSRDRSPRDSWRTSVQSTTSVDRATQTEECVEDQLPTAPTSISRSSSESYRVIPLVNHHLSEEENSSKTECTTPSPRDNLSIPRGSLIIQDQTIAGDPTQARPTSPSFARARLVTIPKRIPPPLPPRNEARISSISESSTGALERETESSIGSYDEDIKIFEVHDDSKGSQWSKADSAEDWSSSEDDDSLKRYESIQELFKEDAATETERLQSTEEESSDKRSIQGGNELQENRPVEKDWAGNSAKLSAENKGGASTWEDASLKGVGLVEEEPSVGETDLVQNIEIAAASPTRALQNGSLHEDKEEFHSTATSPTPSIYSEYSEQNAKEENVLERGARQDK